MAEEKAKDPTLRRDVPPAPEEEPPPVWAVAVVHGVQYLDRAGLMEWLKAREKRAMAAYNSGDIGVDLRGAHALAEACAKLAKKVKGWKKPDVEAAEEDQLDVEAALGELKDQILGA